MSGGFSIDVNGSAVRAMRAGDDFDQGGFARAVLTKEGMDFAGEKIEGDALQSADSAEGFGDGVKRKKRGHE